MTVFVVIAGLLVAAALLFVVPPLLGSRRRATMAASSRDEANVSIYRDQLQELEADLASGAMPRDQYEQARSEVESRVLEDVAAGADAQAAAAGGGSRLLALVVALALPVLAGSLYYAIGNPRGLDPRQAVAAAPAAGSGADQAHDITPQQIQEMVDALAKRLKDNPDNVDGWVMLARSYNVLERFPEAVAAYKQAVQRKPGDGQLLADYADALAMVQGGTLRGEPEQLVHKALQADPRNVKALALAGTAEFDKKNFSGAIGYWQQALAVVPPESQFAQSVKGSIAEAQQLGGMAPATAAQALPAPQAAAATATISGTVKLAPELGAKVAPGDTVFVYARAASGPRMPLAIVRKEVKDLPLSFALDDSMALAPNMKLSSFPQVVVGARISKTGNAMPQPGDFEAVAQPAHMGAGGLTLTIDSPVKQ